MGILFSSDTTEVKDQVLDNLKDIKMWCFKLPEKSQTDLKLTHYFLHFITFQFITVTITQKTQYPPDHPQQAGSRQIGPRQLGPDKRAPDSWARLSGAQLYEVQLSGAQLTGALVY